MTDDSLRGHVEKNRALWDSWAPEWFDRGERGWAADDAYWGLHGIPDSEARLL